MGTRATALARFAPKNPVCSMACCNTTIGNKPLLSFMFSGIIGDSGPVLCRSAPFWAGNGAPNKAKTMKDGIHPNYREVVFLDTSCDFGFVTRSTVATNETIKWKDGKEYPVYKIEISAESHPFYTGKQKIVDTAGRVDKFKKRYARKSSAKAAE